ncbi:MAG: type VI secretion system contractile sheath large subunit [Acidobacteria bacterium]|nr:type VI secretion system contractile sheath large subunit [Acidobacteriota bacterium]MCB9398984.1 type VI secretion system contractile sheath large subunit [Acidobacteriota bacterium]
MAQQSQEQARQEGEGSILDSLLSKVDLTVPEEGIGLASKVEGAAQNQRIATAVNHFISALMATGKKVEKLDRDAIDIMIKELDTKMSAQVSEIMHNEKFQEMESAWRSLKFLVDRTNFRANIKIEVLNCSKEDLRSDMEDAPELLQSGIFQHIYKQEYDQAGGEPIGAVIGNYYFNKGPADVAMLKNMSGIAAGCHCPFISSVGADFMGLGDASELHKIKDMEDLFGQMEYTKWRAFRDSEDSRYVGLTFPRFLLRSPYDPENKPSKSFNFTENVTGKDHNRYLWGNAAIAFASRLTESFGKNGWCVNIRGPQAGGVVEDLPLHLFEEEGEQKIKIPTEVMISDRQELELAEAGFMPLTFYKNRDYACFFSAQSTQKPKKYSTAEATANAKLSCNLPYLFLASRLSHYLKVIQRENIGAAKEKYELQKELDEWIQKLVTTMPNAGAELKAKRPLKEAKITVADIAESPGWYNVEMFIRPHFQVEGVNVALSLVSKMPKSQEK